MNFHSLCLKHRQIINHGFSGIWERRGCTHTYTQKYAYTLISSENLNIFVGSVLCTGKFGL